MRAKEFTNFLIIILLFLTPVVLANEFPLRVTPLDVNGNKIVDTIIAYGFEFSDDATCSNVLSTHNHSVKTNSDGIAYLTLQPNLLSRATYLCEYRNAGIRKIHTLPNAYYKKLTALDLNVTNAYIGDINATNWFYNMTDGSYNLSYQNFAYNESWFNYSFDLLMIRNFDYNLSVGNLLARNITNVSYLGVGTNSPQQELNVVGDLNVTGDAYIGGDTNTTGNSSATFFIGDGSYLTGLQQGNLILFFLNQSSEDITGNKSLSANRNTTEVDLVATGLPDGSTLIGEWITEIGSPALTYLPSGNWIVYVDGTKTGGTKLAQFYYQVYVTNASGGQEVLVSTSGYSDELIATRESLVINTFFPETSLNVTDRIKIKGYAYVTGGGSAPDVIAYVQGVSQTRIEIPAGRVSVENFVPYVNALKNVDLNGYNFTSTGWGEFSTLNVTKNAHIEQLNISTDNLRAFIVEAEDGTDKFRVDTINSNVWTPKQLPLTSDTYDIGSLTNLFRDLYISRNITTTNLNVTGIAYIGTMDFSSGNITASNINWTNNLTTDAGQLGIGTSSPIEALQVVGNILANNYNATNLDTFVGSNTGGSQTGSEVTFIGYLAGGSNTGSQVIGIGTDSGYQNTGSQGSFFGFRAGYQNTGASLLAYGIDAGRGNAGDYVVTVGENSGYDNIGDFNAFLGYKAGLENEGNHSVGVGFFALDDNTANNVVGIGYEALKDNSGNNTVAIGFEAGETNANPDSFILKQNNRNAVPLIHGNFSSGFVGIGSTLEPSHELHVVGDFNISGDIFMRNGEGIAMGGASGPASTIAIGGNGNPFVSLWINISRQTGISTKGTQTGIIAEGQTNEGIEAYTSTGVGGIFYAQESTGTALLTHGGNVGINVTTGPTYQLQVNGNVSLNNTLFVNRIGYVGIGETSPDTQLDINGNTTITGNLTIMEGGTYFVDGTNSAFCSLGFPEACMIFNLSSVGYEFTDTAGSVNAYFGAGVASHESWISDVYIGGADLTTSENDVLTIEGTSNFSGNININGNTNLSYGNLSFGAGQSLKINNDDYAFRSASFPLIGFFFNDSPAGMQVTTYQGVPNSYLGVGTSENYTWARSIAINITQQHAPSYPLHITSNISDISIYAEGKITATNYYDHTDFPNLDYNAIDDIKLISSDGSGQLDHNTLPDRAFFEWDEAIYETYIDDKTGMSEQKVVGYIHREGRDIGAMTSINTKALQELIARVEYLEENCVLK